VRGTFGTGQSGFSVSTAGDFNGDGFDDLIIGAQYAGLRRGDQRGESYIVFGTDAGFPETLSAFDLDGGNGFRFVGRTPEDYLGFSVAAAGDVNGDGFDDVIVGAPGADNGGVSQAGESYVLLGAASGFAALFTPDDLNGQNGFRLEGGGGKRSGASVSGAGDINNDGFDDLIIGAPSAPSPESNYAYVIFGAATGFRYASALGTDGSDWMSLPANWRDGLIGIDGDAGTDMMSFAGLDAQVYVNLGTGRAASIDTSAPFDLTMTGVENITGTGYGDMLVGGDASEWLRGLGGDDMIFGRGAAADRYDGGAGRDTLSYGFAGEGVSVSLFRGIGFAGEAQGDRLSAIENVIGSAHDDIIWGDHGANKLQGGAGDDTLIGNGGDDYLLGGFGQDVVLYAGNQSDYQIRQDGAATWVTDLAGGAGTDLIGQVEILRFADGDLLL
jgi:Ca2+-binding RTX toxin-like protein